MASMDDLIATLSGVQAGQHGNDLKDLHAKLQQTIPSQPYYRPIPPTSSSSTIAPHSNGPLPPPAPASSWNTPTVLNGRDQSGLNGGFGFGSGFGGSGGSGGGASGSPSGRPGGLGTGTSPLRQAGWGSGGQNQYTGGQNQGQGQSKQNGGVPGPKAVPVNGGRRLRSHGEVEEEAERPYHASVLPVKASPKDTGGFDQDAFRPLWAGTGVRGGGQQGREAEQMGGGGDWGGFTGERL